MASGDFSRVPDSETSEIALGLRVPERLVRFAQAGEQQVERLAVVVDDAVPRDPVVKQLVGVVSDPIPEPSDMEVDP